VAPASCNDPTHAELLATLERLVADNRAQAEQIRTLTETVEAQALTIAAQAKRIAVLEERVNRNSSNSSRPPSSDSPYKRAPPRAPSGRKQGGQPGHPGSQRALLDAKDVDEFVPHFPGACSCGHPLPQVPDGDPVREQVWDIPPIKPHVTEHQFHAVVCPHCKKRTVATRGPELPAGSFGPRAQATAVYFLGAGRLSVMETKRVFADLLNFPISAGGLERIALRASNALAPAWDEALVAVKNAAVTHADETPWYVKGALAWLWLAATETLRVFHVDPRRTIDAKKQFLGDVILGVLVSDRYVAYMGQPAERHQFCLEHLKRDGQSLIDRGGAAKPFGEKFVGLVKTAMTEHRAFVHVHHDRTLMQETLRPAVQAMADLLVEGAEGEDDRVANFSAHLIMKAESMWTFLDVEGCPTTNNLSERGLRKPVMWRRNSLGSQSERGCRFVERILTTVESLRAQGRDVLAFLVETMGAAAQGRPPPSLLPPATG